MTAPPAADRALSDVMHEARASVGAIRLAVSTLLESPGDAEFAEELLRNAEGETLRLASLFTALPPLVACLNDRSRREDVDVVAALRSAATGARRLGTSVKVRARGPARALVRPGTFELCLFALIQLSGRDVVAKVSANGGEVMVRVERSDGGAGASGAIVRHLLSAIGAEAEAGESSLAFRLGGSSG